MRKSRLITLAAAASIAATLAATPMAGAADDYFLKIDGVTGESAVGATQGAIQVNSFEWSAENKTTVGTASGGAGAGKATLNQISIEKNVDSTSPVLFQKLGQGAVIGGMELVARKSTGTSPQIYTRYCFQPVFVTSQTQTGSGGDDAIKETLAFTYGAVQQTYTKQATAGAPAGNVFGTWNQVTNTSSILVPGVANTCATSRFS